MPAKEEGISLVASSSSTIDGGLSSCLSTPDKDVLMQVLKEYHACIIVSEAKRISSIIVSEAKRMF